MEIEVYGLEKKIIPAENKKGTFLVNICYCENSTWQGYVVWADKNKKEYFRSALELIEIMNEALDQSAAEISIEDEHSEQRSVVNN